MTSSLRPLLARLVLLLPALLLMPAPGLAQETKPDAANAIQLFDGKSLDGWTHVGPGSFEVADGELHTSGGMGLLWTKREFGDYVLKLDWKVEQAKNNSGIFVRFPDAADPWVAVKEGYEIQICDAEKGNQTGAIYNAKNSTEIASKPAGEWNHYEITVVGPKITVRLNDKVVNEFTGDKPNRAGHIGLQNHDPTSHVSFRNISVTELAPPPATQGAEPSATQASALEPGLIAEYFNDTTNLDTLSDAGKKPFLVRTDNRITFKRKSGEFYGSKLSNNFAVRWSGVVRIAKAGEYGFTLLSDDGSRLFIDGELVLDKVQGSVEEPKSATTTLTAGDHAIRVEFTNIGGPGGIELTWQPPGKKKAVKMPLAVLLHNPQAEQAIGWDKAAWTKAPSPKMTPQEANQPWVKMDYGPFISHTFLSPDTLKGVAVKLGKPDEAAIIFDTELLRYSAGWTGEFLNLDGVAFSGAHGPSPSPAGEIVFTSGSLPGAVPGLPSESTIKDPRSKPFGPMPRQIGKYKGLYRHGNQVVFAYSVGERQIRELPEYFNIAGTPVFSRTIELSGGEQAVTILLADQDPDQPLKYSCGGGATPQKIGNHLYVVLPQAHETRTYRVLLYPKSEQDAPEFDKGLSKLAAERADIDALCQGGPALWNQPVETKGTLGTGDGAYVVDTLTVPEQNPWNSWMRIGGLDFFSDGRAAICTWSGDVWIISGIDDKLDKLTWKRYATGLFQTLGLKIVNDQVYTLGRDQITRFTDLNNDGEADFYENFNNDCEVSTSFHEFSFDLQTDPEGNFYYTKAGPVRPGGRGWQIITDHNGCMLKVSKDGKSFEVFATGLRAPNGMSVGPEGQITTGDNEGTWTPACRLSMVKKGDFLGVVDLARITPPPTTYTPPICWLPHGDVDNSSGGQVWVTSDAWGPFQGDLLHMSYGTCSLFEVMYENVDGVWQGGVARFPLQFDSGICRARFNPIDKQLYVAGLRGWQTNAAKDACVQRVRYTGKPVYMPTDLHAGTDGILLTFTSPLDPSSASDLDNWNLEQWNYIWSSDYGSPEVSTENPNLREHDPVDVESITLQPDGKTVFLKIPEIKPVMQMKIQYKIKAADGTAMDSAIYNTINKLTRPVGKTAVTHAEAGQ